MTRAFEYRHIVGFEETNLVGNVYYANHIRWQGRCREMFLRTHAPDILGLLDSDLALVTLHCSCDYLSELVAFDEVIVRMHLDRIVQNRVSMLFQYACVRDGKEQLIARGRHEIACMRRIQGRLEPTGVPASLRDALQLYAAQ